MFAQRTAVPADEGFSVRELLADRPLVPTIDGAAARSSDTAMRPASTAAGAHVTGTERVGVQRRLGDLTGGAARGTHVVPAAGDPAPVAEAPRPTGYVALDDGRLIEWPHDAPPPSAPPVVQRRETSSTAEPAPAAPSNGTTTTTTAVATSGPGAATAPAVR